VLLSAAAAADGLLVSTAVTAAQEPAVSGYIDSSFNHLSGDGSFTSGMPNRVFDSHSNGFTLQQAGLNLRYQPSEGFGALINLLAGEDAGVIKSYGYRGSTANVDVPQAFVQWADSDVTVIGGKFATLAGAEEIPSPLNSNFSRSILFGYAIPFTHTGVRSTIMPSGTTTLYLGINNGWDDVRDTTAGHTVEIGAAYAPAKTFSVTAMGYFGPQRVEGLVDSGPQGQRSLVDMVMNWSITEATCAVLNYDLGRQDRVASATSGVPGIARWSGLAGYLNHTINDHWKASARAEYFSDPDGYRTGVAQRWREVTGTLAYLIKPHWEFRGELRADSSDAKSFVSADGGHSSRSQNSAAAEIILTF
jgi:Putative beta-barrel porin-2, OmpL-like. bbp2